MRSTRRTPQRHRLPAGVAGQLAGAHRGARTWTSSAAIYGLHGDDARARAATSCSTAAGLTAAARPARPAQLSGGMRRKLGFSMAMVHDPPLLVLDEPSTGVDPVSRVDLWRLVSAGRRAGRGRGHVDDLPRRGRARRAPGRARPAAGRWSQGAPTDVRRRLRRRRSPAPTSPSAASGRGAGAACFHEYWPTAIDARRRGRAGAARPRGRRHRPVAAQPRGTAGGGRHDATADRCWPRPTARRRQRASATSPRSTTCRCRCSRARSSACSAPTEPARRR